MAREDDIAAFWSFWRDNREAITTAIETRRLAGASTMCRRTFAVVFVALLIGCGRTHAPLAAPAVAAAPTPVRTTAPASAPAPAVPLAEASTPTVALASADTCRISDAQTLATVDRHRMRVVVAFHGDVGLAAWAHSENELATRVLDDAGRPVGQTIITPFRKAEGITLLTPVPRGFIALSVGHVCDRLGSDCVQAIAIGPDARPLGAPYLGRPSGQQLSVTDSDTKDGVLFTIETARWGYEVMRYEVAEDGAVRAQSSEGLELDGGGPSDVPLRAVAAGDDGEAFVLAEYESHSGAPPRVARLYRRSTGALTPLRGFGQNPEGIEVSAFEVVGEELIAIFDGKLGRFGFGGETRARPTRLRSRDALPESLRDRVQTRIEAERGRAALVREDMLGTPIGSRTPIAPTMPYGDAVAQVAWVRDHFVAVAAERVAEGIRVTSRAITCTP